MTIDSGILVDFEAIALYDTNITISISAPDIKELNTLSNLLRWMIWQTYFSSKPFDPYPFAFLLFLGNIIQLLLMPLIMVEQNIQGRHSEIRVEEEYKIMITSYKDIEHILAHLDAQDKELLKHAKLLEELIRYRNAEQK